MTFGLVTWAEEALSGFFVIYLFMGLTSFGWDSWKTRNKIDDHFEIITIIRHKLQDAILRVQKAESHGGEY